VTSGCPDESLGRHLGFSLDDRADPFSGTLTGISSRAWEHPADRGALVALRKPKGFDTVLKAISGLVNERPGASGLDAGDM
jgi:hypothetical protein